MKILYLTARQPYPVTKGDQIIAYEQIKELSKRNEIYLISFYNNNYDILINEMNKYCKKIYVFKDTKVKQLISMMKTFYNFTSIQGNAYYRYNINKKIKQIYKEIQPDIIHVQSFRMARYFFNDNIKNKSIDLIDAYSLNMLNRCKKSKKILKPLWYLEYYLLKNYEEEILKKYNYKFIVAERDKRYLGDTSIVVNPNGTTLTENIMKKTKADNNINIIFQGNMSYYPNIQATKFLILELLPKLKVIYNNIKLYIVGSNPTKEIMQYKSNDIIITGYVQSMKPYIDKSELAIYPIFSATGIQNKVLEAMANKLPCIISKEVSLGIPGLINNDNILVANTIEDYLNCFKLIINNKDKINNIIDHGYSLIKENYSWNRHVAVMENIWIDKVVKEY